MKRYAKFVEHGYVVISVGYRIGNEAVFPGPVEDVWNGICHALERAEEYGIDKNRISVTAGSAGTSIAALLAVQHPDVIKAAVLEASILNFQDMRKYFQMLGRERKAYFYPDEDTSIEALFMGGSTLELPDVAKECNPSNHLTPDCPKFLLIHGLVDVDTPYPQSINFARQIREFTGDNTRAELVLLAETGHDNGRYDDPSTFETQLDFLKRTLK
jgi:acetyl esterase/lipase